MKIVVLDGHTLNPGDLSWDELQQLGELEVYDRTAPEEVVGRSRGADVLLTNKARVTGEHIRELSGLKYIGLLATGYDNVDIQAARELQIPVTNVPAYSTDSVAQLTFALILELTHGAGARAAAVREGAWSRSADFCFGHEGLTELSGKTLGLVGFGQIGQAVARIGRAFGMEVTAVVRSPEKYAGAEVRFTGLEACFAEADFVSLHCPLTAENKGMVNAGRIGLMKTSACLINTSRGGLIHEADLAAALNSGRIAGAAVDVLSAEPPAAGNPLLSAANCIVTPHIAWATQEARKRLMSRAAENVKAFLRDTPVNVVN
ncbi:D-2-hydroxyacid dehydrogenase [Compostibacter hankyongensis]|uniref:D-2-hydroxyacid dehydrogenase n=1 Tax=Compostibacter hankyongensis TaxID=1007089 RepID=A0ABP8GAA8_9BACT